MLLTEKAEQVKKEKHTLESREAGFRGDLEKLDSDGIQINERKTAAEAELQKLEQNRTDLLERSSSGPEKERISRRLAEIKELSVAVERRLETTKESDDRLSAELSELENPVDIQSLDRQIGASRRTRNDFNDRYNSLRQQLEREQSQQDSFDPSAFHRSLGEALRVIERDNGYKVKPIGPLGRYVTLKDPRWRMLLESQLDSTLSSFWVQSSEDRNRLRSVFSRLRISNCPIVVRKPELYDFPRIHGHNSILDVLDFHHDDTEINENIKRLFIDLSNIEKVALIPKREDASRVMSQDGSRQILFALAFSSDQGTGKVGAMGHRVNAYSTRRLEGKDMYRMGMDNQVRIRELSQSLAEEQEKLRAADEKLESFKRQKSTRSEEIVRLRSEQRLLRSELTQLKVQLQGMVEERVQLEASVDDGAISNQLEHLQSRIDVCKEDIKRHVDLFLDLKVNKAKTREDLKQLKGELKKIDETVTQFLNRQAKLEDEKSAAATEIQRMKRTADEQIAHIARFERKKKDIDEKKAIYDKKLQELLQIAVEKLPERVEIEQDVDLVQERENMMDLIREHRDANHMQAEEAAIRRAREKGQEYKNTLDGLQKLKASFRATQNSSAQHQMVSRNVERLVIHDVERNFKDNLLQRGFEGDLVIDNKTEKVLMRICPANKGSEKRDVATLSGGEKSFSQIAFLVSLWESMQCSLLALDEL
jgi:chromosome segregation ATPase